MDNKLTNINSFVEDLRTSSLSREELFEKAKSLYESEQTILNAMTIFNFIADTEDRVLQVLQNSLLKLLQHQDNRVQELTISVISKLVQKHNFKELSSQVLDLLINVIIWDDTFIMYNQSFKFAQTLLKEQFPDMQNKIKVMEPMFMNKYYFTNRKEYYIQGLLGVMELFLEQKYNMDKVIEVIEIIQRIARHQNKYVRLYAQKFVHNLFQFFEGNEYKAIIIATIQQGLMDESLEVRMQALKEYQILNPKNKDCFLIPLLNNCHTDNLMEIAANIAQQHFPSVGGPPILGLITIIRDRFLKECLIYNYHCTTSRYYQIRSSGLSTLQTITLFMKQTPNVLPHKEILKAAQNCTLFETDPIVRQAGFSLMYHISRLHMNEVLPYQQQIVDNCLFHLSDVPLECKEFCAKILALFKDHTDLIKNLQQKVQVVKDKELAYQDFVGVVPNTEEAQTHLQKSLEAQGGKDKVVSKHQSQTLLGITMCFKQISILSPDEQLLKQMIVLISSCLKYIDWQRHFILQCLIEGLQELKIVKRLPIKLLDETDILAYLKQYNETELLNRIGEIVGPTILKGRL
ncbi:unnamed protein product (macronuclear) [Paramecium tetraurelia]|uniref:Uncharacterized protein n=1 Tax=Paramecium tetraurelia TaxID=5888 RepID=A0BKE4_PARTE|nr:uncharacterized protein GSPATT00029642001 [Paramecium tetraurelia]CAK59011.1 unnamed protein product [Paramecium tetraurelia]|eukprot:XP_001426409.1 hypothetical protein (macronuclear) [Paramecium tetraurelia strain d4-2]